MSPSNRKVGKQRPGKELEASQELEIPLDKQELSATEAASFDWISRGFRGPSYISYSQFNHRSAWAFEFGANGNTGCCNHGGELMQLSAALEDEPEGLIFARGEFSSSIYASLARSQMEYGRSSTFGLEVARNRVPYGSDKNKNIEGSSFRLGKMLERGCFNYRWPLNEYALHSNSMKQEPTEARSETKKPNTNARGEHQWVPVETAQRDHETGTCTTFSFIKKGICYQVLRIQQSREPDGRECEDFSLSSQLVLSIGGPVLLQSWQTLGDHEKVSEVPTLRDTSTATKMKFVDMETGIGLEAKVWEMDTGADYSPEGFYKPLELRRNKICTDTTSKGHPKPSTYSIIVPLKCRRKVVFFAAFRLFKGRKQEEREMQNSDLPMPDAIHKHVVLGKDSDGRIKDGRSTDTGRTGLMWASIFLGRHLHTGSVPEPTEVSLLGRCMEKILQVDLVPRPKSSYSTLVSNSFVEPTIDLKAFFWKTRFLCKVHTFLSSVAYTKETKPSLEHTNSSGANSSAEDKDGTPWTVNLSALGETERQTMLCIAREQLHRIRGAVHDMASFLARMLRGEVCSADKTPRGFTATDESDKYYAMISLWYIVKHLSRHNVKLKNCLWELDSHHVSGDLNYTALNQGKLPLLRWYYYASILGLQRAGFLPNYWELNELERKVYSLGRDAQVALSARLVSKVPYSAEDEIVDRLAFLASELGLEKDEIEVGSDAGTMASLAIRHVKRRDFTRYINPGWVPSQEDGYASAPWELHALCHNSRLNVLALEKHDAEDWRASAQKAVEVELYKGKLYLFLNAEATLVSCWERSHLEARKGWLRSEATAVLGATLLDIHCASAVAFTSQQQQSEPQSMKKASAQQGWKGQLLEEAALLRAAQRKSVQETVHGRHLAQRQVDLLEKAVEVGPAPPIDWTAFAPRRQYHPNDFIQSLEDTPHVFRPPFTDARAVPAAIRAAAPPPPEGGFDRNHVANALDAARGSVSVSDVIAVCFSLWDDGGGPEQRRRSERAIAGAIRHIYNPATMPEPLRLRGMRPCGTDNLVEALYDSLVDRIVQHRFLTVRRLTDELVRLLVYVTHPECAVSLSNHVLGIPQFSCQNGFKWTARITLLSWFPENNPAALKCQDPPQQPPPDSTFLGRRRKRASQRLKRLSNHHATAPDPSKEDSEATGTPVNSRPRLPHECSVCQGWYFRRPTGLENTGHKHSGVFCSETEDPDRAICMPSELNSEHWRSTNNDKYHVATTKFHLMVSSLVLSTNGFGDFSKCIFISQTLKPEDPVLFAEMARDLWLSFVHQPQTARCLVFLLGVGLMCDMLSEQYKEATDHFSSVVDFRTVFLDEMETWRSDNTSMIRFKVGLWSLDSLHKLQSSLRASTESILEAKEELMRQIRQGAINRSEPLQRRCQEYLAKFEGSLVRLLTIKANLESTIELHNRYKDALSAVLALRDSRESLKQGGISIAQNRAIHRLTNLTIGYLPMSLMAAIFAIPDTQQVVAKSMGVGWFVGGILLLASVTFFLAWNMALITDWVRDRFSRNTRQAGMVGQNVFIRK